MDYRQRNKKGAQGIGTLIIFIALILVAAVAAGVLIQTSSSLQSAALDVGRQSQDKITTDIDVVQVYATNTSDGDIAGTDNDTITMLVRLGSGSNSIKLSDLLVKFDSSYTSQTLTYISGSYTTTRYNATYLATGPDYKAGYLSAGDLASFVFEVDDANTIGESESVTLRLIAKNGAVKPVDITTPPALIQITTYLYP